MATKLNLLNPLKLQVPEEEKEEEEKEDFDAEPGTKKEEEDYFE